MKAFRDYGIDVPDSFTGEKVAICSKCSPTRKKKNVKCLSVNGDKSVWVCHHCGWSGSLKDGILEQSKPYQSKKVYIKLISKQTTLPNKVVEWFENRKISQDVLSRNKIGYEKIYMPQIEAETEAITFSYFRNNELINIKYRDNKKNFRLSTGAERIFYGLDDIIGDTAIIVEGEIDKFSLEMAGYLNVLSVPNGAPPTNTKNYEKTFDYLESAKSIFDKLKIVILAGDNDEPGQKLIKELARRIGKERCKYIQWPESCKDANDVLLKYGKDNLKNCIEKAEPYPIEGLFTVRNFEKELDSLYEKGFESGEFPGWLTLEPFYTVKPGELTVVTGIPSHGKSEFIDALVMNLAQKSSWPIAIYSPENRPLEIHAQKLIEKFVGSPFRTGYKQEKMSRNEYVCGKYFLDEKFTFILPVDDTKNSLDNILALAKAAVFRKGIKGLIIDPWNEIDHTRPAGLTETEYISQSLTKIRKFARVYSVHVWLIAHPTKLFKEKGKNIYPVPTPYDISGSAHWKNKADNAITVWRDIQDINTPVQIHIQKIRFKHIGKIGMIELNYNYSSGRYFE